MPEFVTRPVLLRFKSAMSVNIEYLTLPISLCIIHTIRSIITQNNNDSKFSKFLLGLKLMGWSTSAFIIILSSSLFSSKCSPKTGSNFSSLWHWPLSWWQSYGPVITCDFALHRHAASCVVNLHPIHLNINRGKPCKRSKCVPILCLWVCRCPGGQNKQDDNEGINLFETKPK